MWLREYLPLQVLRTMHGSQEQLPGLAHFYIVLDALGFPQLAKVDETVDRSLDPETEDNTG